MDQPKFTVDTSVVVKWLNQEGESDTNQALSLLHAAKRNELLLLSSDLIPIEVSNALVWSKKLRNKLLEEAIHDLFSFPVQLITTDEALASEAGKISQEYGITIYDAMYLAVAMKQNASLITADSKHQTQFKKISVINLANWPLSEEDEKY